MPAPHLLIKGGGTSPCETFENAQICFKCSPLDWIPETDNQLKQFAVFIRDRFFKSLYSHSNVPLNHLRVPV